MSSSNGGFVYILASKPNGTLYVGVTNDIVRRAHQHRTGAGSDFVDQYDVTRSFMSNASTTSSTRSDAKSSSKPGRGRGSCS